MKDVQFLSYIETPSEKYMGIASILFDDSVILRYKIQAAKEGDDFYIKEPSFKNEMKDEWFEWHSMERKSQNEKILDVIRENVKKFLKSKERSPF